MMIELFLKSSAIYILGLLARSIAIFLVPLYTRYLTAEQYGIVDYFLLFGNVVSVVFSVEISQAIARFYHDLSSEGDRVSYVSTGLIFLCIMYGVYFIFSGVFSTFFIEWLFDGQLSYSRLFGNLSIISSGIFYYVQNQLKWQMRAKEFVLASLVNMVITALLSWYLLAAKHQGIEEAGTISWKYNRNSLVIQICRKYLSMDILSKSIKADALLFIAIGFFKYSRFYSIIY